MFLFPKQNYHGMKNYAQFNIIIVDFISIVIILIKYNTFYFTYPPRKHDFSHILPSCLLFIAESGKYHQVVVLLHNDRWLKTISTKFNEVLKQCSIFYLRYCVLRYFVKLPPF
jgi:hypothetical protein